MIRNSVDYFRQPEDRCVILFDRTVVAPSPQIIPVPDATCFPRRKKGRNLSTTQTYTHDEHGDLPAAGPC